MPPRLGALLAIVFWGLSFVATKAAVGEIAPLSLVFFRAGQLATVAGGMLLLTGVFLVERAPAHVPRPAPTPISE